MVFPPLHRSAPLWLGWIGGLSGAVVLLLADLLPFRLPFATPANFFLCLVECQLFFALLVWPFFVPGLLGEGVRAPLLLAFVGLLVLLALPLVLIGANVSSVGAGTLVRSQALVAGMAVLGAGVAARGRCLPWYVLAVFGCSAALPFWFFLGDQMGARSPALSVYLSPFWGAAVRDPAPGWVQAALFGSAGAVLLALPRRKERA